MDPRKRVKRPLCREPVIPPLIQSMPGARVRVDPLSVNQIAAWLIAVSAPWERECSRTLTGLVGSDRDAMIGRRRFARHALSAVRTILERLTETIPAADFNRAAGDIRRAFAELGAPPPSCIPSFPIDCDPKEGE